MGATEGTKTCHKATGLSQVDVADICKELGKKLGMARPEVVFDISNIVYIFSKASSKTAAVVDHLVKWGDAGIIAIPVCDGAVRPVSKQATNQRIANGEKYRIKAFKLRTEIRKSKQRLNRDRLNATDRTALLKSIKKLESNCKRNETLSKGKVPKNLVEELRQELSDRAAHCANPVTGGRVGEVVVSEFEADALMCHKLLGGKAVMAETKDSDINIISGGITISCFTKGKFELSCTHASKLQDAMKCLSNESTAVFKPAEFPIFDGVESPRLRALMMVMMGCDVYIAGMKGMRVTRLAALATSINAKSEDALYSALFYKFKSANGLTDEDVNTHIDALIYQPANPAKECSDDEDPVKIYMFGPPTRLPKYLEQFAVDKEFKQSCVFPGPDISICKGVSSSPHPFLSSDGVVNCSRCSDTLCPQCNEKIGVQTFCMPCFAIESIVPQYGCAKSKSIAEMRQCLIGDNFDGAKDLQSDEVEDAYEMIEYLRNYRELEKSVAYPFYAADEMTKVTKWEELIEIDFKEGGAFLAEPGLGAKHVPGILDLFASLVRFEESGKKTEWIKDTAVYDSIPSLFIKFADGSRVDSGYRLLMRCVRHSFDSRTPSLDKNSAMLVLHNGEVGIHLNSLIPASMKKSVYRAGVVATAKDILCCRCTCHCGAQDSQRILCIHILPLLFLLTLLLFEDLAEHILLELMACMSSDIWDKSIWSENDNEVITKSIITLMEAAGEQVGTHDIDSATGIEDLLQKFAVGTERRKQWKKRIKSPPKPSELGPISEIVFHSTAKQAKISTQRCMNVGEQMGHPQDFDISNSSDVFSPNYHRISCIIEAADCEGVYHMNFAGINLLNMRSDIQEFALTKIERTTMSKQMAKGWNLLKRLAAKRSIRGLDTKISNIPKKKARSQQVITRKQHAAVVESPVRPPPLQRPGQHLPLQPKPKKVSLRCAKCDNNNVNSPCLKFHLVTSFPAKLTSKNPKKNSIINREGRILLRQEIMDRVGESRYCDRKRYVCENHTFETIVKRKLIKYKGNTFVQRYQLTVPCGEGIKSTLSPSNKRSKGIGRDRAMRFILEEAASLEVETSLHTQAKEMDELLEQLQVEYEHITCPKHRVRNLEEQHLVKDAQLELAKSNMVQASKTVQQMAEETCKDKHIPINSSLLDASGLVAATGNAAEVVTPNKYFFNSSAVKTTKLRSYAADSEPSVHLGLPDSEVKRRTGFPSMSTLLTYIFVVCNGDINIIKSRKTSLTWFEEWFMHFEYIWGKSLTRFIDLEKEFDINRPEIQSVISSKYEIEVRAMLSWPTYASLKEDTALRNKTLKWRNKYSGMRPVMWDMTNVSAYGFTDADFQRITYSEYYNENCFKGGVFTQICGWQGVKDLWTGKVSDSDYNRRAGYLQEQEQFQNEDFVETETDDGWVSVEIVPFLNIYDKGYRAKMAAWKNGKQLVLQPDWATSDRRFGRKETITSASVASDRGGNERSVNVSKRAGYIRRGFCPNMCPIRFNNAWRTWAFQSNFMFQPVL